MPIWLGILVGVVALVAGVALGFFIARKYMMNYLEKNPPINEQMLKMMMMQMGQKPSQKKINQMMSAMSKVLSLRCGKLVAHLLNLLMHQPFFQIVLEHLQEVLHHFVQALLILQL